MVIIEKKEQTQKAIFLGGDEKIDALFPNKTDLRKKNCIITTFEQIFQFKVNCIRRCNDTI